MVFAHGLPNFKTNEYSSHSGHRFSGTSETYWANRVQKNNSGNWCVYRIVPVYRALFIRDLPGPCYVFCMHCNVVFADGIFCQNNSCMSQTDGRRRDRRFAVKCRELLVCYCQLMKVDYVVEKNLWFCECDSSFHHHTTDCPFDDLKNRIFRAVVDAHFATGDVNEFTVYDLSPFTVTSLVGCWINQTTIILQYLHEFGMNSFL